MVLLKRFPIAGPLLMSCSTIGLCGLVLASTAYGIDWTPLIPDGDGIVNGADGRDDTTWIATLLVVLGAVVALTILGGVGLVIKLMLGAFKESLSAQRAADDKRFETTCATFTTECERQRADHREQRAEDRVAFDRRTDQIVEQLSDLPERLSTAVLRAMKVGG